MIIWCILCAFHGVQSAALKGSLHRFADSAIVVEAEAPVFVAQGFLKHNVTAKAVVSVVAGRHRHLEKHDNHASARDECTQACGKGVDSTCVPECQVRLYGCLDYDRTKPEGAKQYKQCKEELLKKYSKFAEDWEATHPYLANLILKKNMAVCAADVEHVHDKCVAACGKGADSSCVPECQVKLYACLDHDRTVPEGKEKHAECEKDVLEEYRNFAATWNKTHPYLLAVGHADADAKTLDEINTGCTEACGIRVDSSCVPECQVNMYSCLDHDRKTEEGSKKYKKCTAEVLSKYERFADDWDAAHPYLLAVRRHVGSAELQRVQDKCADVCGKGVDSSCVPECQVDMYACLDHDRKTEEGAEKYDECEARVIKEFEKFDENWDATHPY